LDALHSVQVLDRRWSGALYKDIPASVTAFFRDHILEIRYGRLTLDFIVIDGKLVRVDKSICEQTKNQ